MKRQNIYYDQISVRCTEKLKLQNTKHSKRIQKGCKSWVIFLCACKPESWLCKALFESIGKLHTHLTLYIVGQLLFFKNNHNMRGYNVPAAKAQVLWEAALCLLKFMHSFIVYNHNRQSYILHKFIIFYNKLQRAAYSSMPNTWLALHTASVQPNLFSVESDFISNYFPEPFSSCSLEVFISDYS